LLSKKNTAAEKASKFCNGSSVKETNEKVLNLARTSVDGFVRVSEGMIAQMVIKLYSMGIISEPSGALGLAGLTKMKQLIKGKNVAVILTGANIDLTQLNQARDMNLISKGYKNCYLIELPNKKNVIYELITNCFKETDIITIQYSKKSTKETSQALISVESLSQEDVEESIEKLRDGKFTFEIINEKEQLLDLFF
jgi:threonine dehydratase